MSYHYKMQLWGNGPILEVVACHQFKSTAKMSQHNFFVYPSLAGTVILPFLPSTLRIAS